MTGIHGAWIRWRPRTSLSVLVPLLVAVSGSWPPLPAAQTTPVSNTAAQQTVRDRLERAAVMSRELFKRASPDSTQHFASLALVTSIPEDAPGLLRGRFSPLKDVREYWAVRPWEPAYGWSHGASVPVVATEDWPTRRDAPELRALLNDGAPAIRGLAVEALGALGLPEDVRSIGSLLTDAAPALPALARTAVQSSIVGIVREGEDELVPLVWSERTVGAYARAAILLMTGRRFDGNVAYDLSFQEWIETHDLGAESLWYWQQRLIRERNGRAAVIRSPGEDARAFSDRRWSESLQHQAALRRRTASELERLSPEAQAKVFLLTGTSDSHLVTGPVNQFFPDGLALRISRERILELLDGRNIWRDCLDLPQAKGLLLWRLARLAPSLLPARDWPHVREALQMRAPGAAGTPVLVSRLLPAARTGQADNSDTRDGFLRASLARSLWDYRLQLVAEEMVRTNLEVQWPFLAARFDADPAVARAERVGALRALAEEPSSPAKLRALVAFLDDPRNAPLLTLPSRFMGDDQVRQHAIWALDALAGVTPSLVPMRLRDDLHHDDRSREALIELRRLGHALLAQRNVVAVSAPIPVVARPSPAQSAAPRASGPAALTRQAVRARLERAVAGSRELFERAPPANSGRFAGSLAGALIPEDDDAFRRGRFSLLKDLRDYWRLRPWEPAYGNGRYLFSSGLVPAIVTENWPTRNEAPALRDLLSHADPAIRGLAVEALGALALPEDIGRIGALLTDASAAGPALARPALSNSGLTIRDDGAFIPMAWSDRTVSAYARAAVLQMTGQTFDGKSTVFTLSFPEWLDTHDLGWESLWYWKRRLWREQQATAGIERLPGEQNYDFVQRLTKVTNEYRAELRKQSALDLGRLTADAQAKIFLLTDADNDWESITRPINRLFPEGFTLRIGRERILELLDGHNIWRDLESDEQPLLWNIARLTPTLLPTRDWPHVRDQLQARASFQPGMPVLVSRLLPVAGVGQVDDPRTREGFLRASLAKAIGNQRVHLIVMEMLRTNIEAHWSFLAGRFNADPAVGRWERLGVLNGLAEAPHSREKLMALVRFVEDPRNGALLTERGGFPAALAREFLMDALRPFSAARASELNNLQQDLGNESRQGNALIELRRLARALLAQSKTAR